MSKLVYLCCVPQDEAARAALVTHLTPRVRAGELALWPEDPAQETPAARREKLSRAEVVVPVLSASRRRSATR